MSLVHDILVIIIVYQQLQNKLNYFIREALSSVKPLASTRVVIVQLAA